MRREDVHGSKILRGGMGTGEQSWFLAARHKRKKPVEGGTWYIEPETAVNEPTQAARHFHIAEMQFFVARSRNQRESAQ